MRNRKIKSNKIWHLLGFISDGLDEGSFVDTEGDVWHTDEYGDRSYMWEYR